MKREVWVECKKSNKHSLWTHRACPPGESYGCDFVTGLEKVTIHESRWIPVSDRMPEKPEHYLVVRLDRLDWCYCECLIEGNETRFTSKGVTHWLEAPPLPVEDEFEKWLMENYPNHTGIVDYMKFGRAVWNAAKESNGPRP